MVYWLVFFSIIVHGLSVPLLNAIYKFFKVTPIHDDPVEVVLLSENEPLPNNSTATPQRHSAILNNRFARRDDEAEDGDGDDTQSMMVVEHAAREYFHHHHHHHHLHLHRLRRRQSLRSATDELEILQQSEEGRSPSIERPTTGGGSESVQKGNHHIEMREMI